MLGDLFCCVLFVGLSFGFLWCASSFEVLYITVRIAIERLENIGNVFEGMHIGLQIGNLGLTTFNS